MFLAAAAGIAVASGAIAQATDKDPRDRLIAADAAAPASNWKGQAWWKPLAQCVLVYQQQPRDAAKEFEFVKAAMDRVATDRKVEPDVAIKVVTAWNQTMGARRATTAIDILGIDGARSVCDAALRQYRAL